MKYIRQFGIILAFIFAGEGLRALLPFPVPASIYGLALLFLGLFSGLIRLDWVEEAADWLVASMPITFVPASVALIDDWAILKPFLWPLLLICTVSTVAIFGASGLATQALIRLEKKKPGKEKGEAPHA